MASEGLLLQAAYSLSFQSSPRPRSQRRSLRLQRPAPSGPPCPALAAVLLPSQRRPPSQSLTPGRVLPAGCKQGALIPMSHQCPWNAEFG